MIVIRRGGSGNDADRRVEPARKFDGAQVRGAHVPAKFRATFEKDVAHVEIVTALCQKVSENYFIMSC